jgi:hypothetical protein
MHSEPRHLLVRPGSEGLGVVGTLLTGVGVTAVLAATAILLSGSTAPEKLDKPAVAIPIYIVGGVALATGIVMSIVSDTDIDEQKAPPAKPMARGFGLAFALSF